MPWWCWASYMDLKHGHMEESFSGPWPTEAESFAWGNKHFATIAGATFKPVFSKSIDRNCARNETRHMILESGQRGGIPDVLNIRFRNLGKEE